MYKKLIVFFIYYSLPLERAIALSDKPFPSNFKFGVATAAYQVEGAWNEGGKSENIWDRIIHTRPYLIENGDNADIACDSYHKYKEDVAMIKELGVDHYRFSVSWSRIVPKGLAGSAINQIGIDYYRNLTKELLDNGIEPLVTIFHWDTPQILQDIGGWPNPELEDHYVYYARALFQNLGDLVKYWLTFNEPMQICQQGYGSGVLAPGIKGSGVADYQCTHTLLKAHARAYHIYNDEFRATQQGRVGIVIDTTWFEPASDKEEDQEASERILQFTYGWFTNPIFNGNYPQIMIDRIDERSRKQGFAKSRLPKFTQEEIGNIKGTHDFLALNSYSTAYAQWKEDADVNEVSYESDLSVYTFVDDTWEQAASPWIKVVPWGLRKLLNWIKKTYNNPEIFITENGFSDNGGPIDLGRINYHKEYLSNVLDAIYFDEVNVTRYTAWSLMDNFEWGRGYKDKFGLFGVDFNDSNRIRTLKASTFYFKEIVRKRCLVNVCQN